MPKRDLAPLSGALFVLFVVVTFAAAWGDTPAGDVAGPDVVSYYDANGARGMVAAVLLGLSVVPLLVFSAALRERMRATLPDASLLPGLAFAAGIVAGAGFLAQAGVHFAVADYGDELTPAAAQAVNAIDADLFLPFSMGLLSLVLAVSLAALRSEFLPTPFGWVGVVLFGASVTPAGAVAVPLAVLWIVVASVVIYRQGAARPWAYAS